jgi:hypothetical protein
MTLALDQERDGLPRLVDGRAQFLDGVDAGRAHADDHVARLHASSGRGAARAFDDEPRLHPGALFIGSALAHDDAELALGLAFVVGLATLPSSSVPIFVDISSALPARHFDVERRAGSGAADTAQTSVLSTTATPSILRSRHRT